MFDLRSGFGIGTVVVIVCAAATVRGSDDAEDPLYIYRDGKRIPTVIIPPKKAEPKTARPAVLTVQERPADSRGEQPAADAARTGQAPPPGARDEAGRAGAPTLEDSFRAPRYAGHRVSFTRRHRRLHSYHPYLVYGGPQAFEEAYVAGRLDERYDAQHDFNYRDMAYRAGRLLTAHERTLRHGQLRLREGDYAKAIVALSLAADLNNGDPACRIHLAQARMAQGHYDEAGKVLRRALQLQPKLIYAQLHLETYYADAREMDKHVDKLAAHVKKNPASANTYFLLGYVEYQRDDFDAAHVAFRRVAKVLPKDDLTRAGLKITRPAAP